MGCSTPPEQPYRPRRRALPGAMLRAGNKTMRIHELKRTIGMALFTVMMDLAFLTFRKMLNRA